VHRIQDLVNDYRVALLESFSKIAWLSHEVECSSGALEFVFSVAGFLGEFFDLAVLSRRDRRRRQRRGAGVAGSSPLGQLARVHALASANSPLVPGAQLRASEDIQFLIDAKIRLVGRAAGSNIVVHVIIFWSREATFVALVVVIGLFVSSVSPREMEFVRQVSHADLRVRGTRSFEP